MIILGINASHTATACLLVDGEIKACIAEERISRIKDDRCLPALAVKEIFRITGLSSKDIDLLLFSFNDPKANAIFTAVPGTIDKKNKASLLLRNKKEKLSFTLRIKKIAWFIKIQLLVNLPFTRHFYNNLLPIFYRLFVDPTLEENVLVKIEKELGIPRSKVKTVDHHTAHAYSAIFTAPQFGKKPLLALTADGMGDGLCSTVRVVRDNDIEVLARTPIGNGLGDLYSYTTRYLGMVIREHDYKVMGLAPYANQKRVEKLYLELRKLIWVNDDLTFSTVVHSHVFHKILPKIYELERFDTIAGAVQLLAEKLLVEWVNKAIKKTGIHDVVCAGGVFMNVKANQKILESSEVKSLYVVPSCGDESSAFGAAFWGYDKFSKQEWNNVKSLKHLYLGTDYSETDIEKVIKKINKKNIRITRESNIDKKIAELLSKGKVVARFSGPMEFGARALGNRSILSHPANLDAVREINESIKSRDFWMPFAPSVLEERQGDYFKNPKNYPAYFMTITFDTTERGKEDLKAAMHQYDFTVRPQVVKRKISPSYHKLITEFEKLTGIGAVLNTSFNLHGYPIVMLPKDALEVFEKSGLNYLALGNFLIYKDGS